MKASATTPIKRQIANIFIPVSDVHSARRWYRDVLGLPVGEILAGHLCCIPMDEGAGLLLDQKLILGDEDQGPRLAKGAYPLFMFATDDIHASLDMLRRSGVEVVEYDGGAIQHGHWFNFRDCEGNLLMVCSPQPVEKGN